MLYSQYFNRKRNATGHLWQGRFFSCVLDEQHLYTAVRYVELNPVRSGIVAVAQDYPWSSARAHVTGTDDPLLSGHCFLSDTVADWAKYLGEDQGREDVDSVIKATRIGRPCGNEEFVKQMEEVLNRRFTASPRGRPRKVGEKK